MSKWNLNNLYLKIWNLQYIILSKIRTNDIDCASDLFNIILVSLWYSWCVVKTTLKVIRNTSQREFRVTYCICIFFPDSWHSARKSTAKRIVIIANRKNARRRTVNARKRKAFGFRRDESCLSASIENVCSYSALRRRIKVYIKLRSAGYVSKYRRTRRYELKRIRARTRNSRPTGVVQNHELVNESVAAQSTVDFMASYPNTRQKLCGYYKLLELYLRPGAARFCRSPGCNATVFVFVVPRSSFVLEIIVSSVRCLVMLNVFIATFCLQ